jgi:hypothetical protein
MSTYEKTIDIWEGNTVQESEIIKHWFVVNEEFRYSRRGHGLPFLIHYQNNKIKEISAVIKGIVFGTKQRIDFSLNVQHFDEGFIQKNIGYSYELIYFHGLRDSNESWTDDEESSLLDEESSLLEESSNKEDSSSKKEDICD